MTATTELSTWLNGTPTGGPFSDGRYPLTYADGLTYLVYCPAAQALNPLLVEQPIEVFANTANNAAATATAEAAEATQAAVSAASSAASALASKVSANSSEVLAQAWADNAVDVPVVASKFSSKHWATKAEQAAATLAVPTWGSITGDFNNQTDLISFINAVISAHQGAGIFIGANPPTDPIPGQRWVDDLGIEYTFLQDADSGQWVELGPYNINTAETSVIDGGSYG